MTRRRRWAAESLPCSGPSACLSLGSSWGSQTLRGVQWGLGAVVAQPKTLGVGCHQTLLFFLCSPVVTTLVGRCWMGPGVCLISCPKLLFPNRVVKQLYHKTRFFPTACGRLPCWDTAAWGKSVGQRHSCVAGVVTRAAGVCSGRGRNARCVRNV